MKQNSVSPSKVKPAVFQEMLYSEGKLFLSHDYAGFGFFCPTQSSTVSQWTVYFKTHHMFWCHILHSLNSMLCTHHSVLTDCMTTFLLFQVFKLKQLQKNQALMSNSHKDTVRGSGTRLWSTLLPRQPTRRLFTVWPGAQGWLSV